MSENRIRRGLRHPEKIPPYLGRKLRETAARVRLRFQRATGTGPSVLRADAFTDSRPPADGFEAVAASVFPSIEFENENQRGNFRTYLQLPYLAGMYGCDSVLEIGSGFSTAIWAQYAEATGADVVSVDANFAIFDEWVRDTAPEDTTRRNVDRHEGLSVEPETIRSFYATPQDAIGGVPVTAFADTLDRFGRLTGCPWERYRAVDSFADTASWSIADLLVRDGAFDLPEGFVEPFVGQATLEDHLTVLEGVSNAGVTERLSAERAGWDFVWFDSGEPSSLVEWTVLKDHVAPGGLAAFHDVFFPKSMKNFVVAASVLHDDEWDVILVDDSTPQGLLVAQRSPEA